MMRSDCREARETMNDRYITAASAAKRPGKMLLLAVLASLAACTTTHVPVVPDAVQCEVPATLLQSCESPQRLKDGITYGELLLVYQSDRQALVRCGADQDGLMKAVAICRAEVDGHNARLKELNEALKARK
jgi:hypothetical protein